jgi:RNA polymerase sigma-70 factor (ECF subfamily)
MQNSSGPGFELLSPSVADRPSPGIRHSEPGTREARRIDGGRADDRRTDEAVVAAYALLMQADCRRVYRVVRSVLSDPAEIEDVMHQTYVSTFIHADGDTIRESTWLCRIALNEALARIRQRGRFVSLDAGGEAAAGPERRTLSGIEAMTQTADLNIVRVFETVVDRLSEIYRTVLIMRDVEGMTVGETAAVLSVDTETVKLRLQQARMFVKRVVKGYSSEVFQAAFPLDDEICARVTGGVKDALRWTLHLSDHERGRDMVVGPSGRVRSGRA